uniref:ANF_receptor domain-containing protein n=1 Tax=Steinernema glaseri TaxID=37863 RepID=A0A1I7YUC5_9BILA
MFVKGLLFLLFSSGCAFRFGAVLQEKRDAHLAAALHYAVEWINHEKMWGTFALSIKYVDPVDYYEATSQVVMRNRIACSVPMGTQKVVVYRFQRSRRAGRGEN